MLPNPTSSDDHPLRDVQGGRIRELGTRCVKVDVYGDENTEPAKIATRFVVADSLREPIFSAVKLAEAGATHHFARDRYEMRLNGNSYEIMIRGGRTYLKTKCGSNRHRQGRVWAGRNSRVVAPLEGGSSGSGGEPPGPS